MNEQQQQAVEHWIWNKDFIEDGQVNGAELAAEHIITHPSDLQRLNYLKSTKPNHERKQFSI